MTVRRTPRRQTSALHFPPASTNPPFHGQRQAPLRFPGRDADRDGPALSSDNLPLLEDSDSDIASESEAAEAFGTTTANLRAEIMEEEQQRHPDLHDSSDHAFGTDEIADALRRRMEQRNRH